MSMNATALEAPWLSSVVSNIGPARPLFAVVSGAHLYGFPSSESDVDVRGAHVLPLDAVLSIHPPRETHNRDARIDGMRIDLVSHDIAKYLRLLVAKNGYVLEQITSPHVVVARSEFEQLRSLALGFVNRTLYHHYRGFVRGRWKAFTSEEPKRVKTLLYVYRVLLTGTHLMSTGEVECNLVHLAKDRHVEGIDALIDRKRSGENTTMEREEVERHAQRISMLEADMLRAYESSPLPESAPNVDDIDRFLIDVRVATRG